MDFSYSDILDGRGTIFDGRVIYRKCFLLFCSLCGALLPNVAQQENINMMKKMTKERGLCGINMTGYTESHTPHMIYDITTLVRHAAERKLEIEQNKMKRIEVKYASYLAIG